MTAAPQERASKRFATLLEWVRLPLGGSDGAEKLRQFREAHPDYFPAPIYDETARALEGRPELAPGDAESPLESWQDSLRRLWEGVTTSPIERNVLTMLGEAESDATRNWQLARAGRDIDWKTGEITHSYAHPFQRDLSALLHERWRARICHNCGRPFIADKPPQKQCSAQCYVEFKSKWKKRDEEGTTDKRFRRVRARRHRKRTRERRPQRHAA